jgi:uncharacterized protein (TIGR03000 family)
MKRNTIPVLLAATFLVVNATDALAWGRGGGGFRAGGFAAGGYRGGFSAGGYRGAGFAGYRGGAVGYRGGAVGYRSAEVGGYHGGAASVYRGADIGGYRGGAVRVEGAHVGVATDFGFGHVAGAEGARGYVAAGNLTRAYSTGALAVRGVAVRGDFSHYGVFNSGWWAAHPAAWRPYGWDAARYWGWATWPALAGWLGWSAAPVYYDYGTNIVYQGDQVLIDNQPGPTATAYYQQAADLAQSAPAAPPPEQQKAEWQPLGVFALVQGEQSDTSAVFQLAVNKAGIIGGNYYNVLTDTTLPVHGAVDKTSQRASWFVGDQKTTIYDTGIYNLTKDESPLLIHFGKDRTQQWLLVRVPEKDARAATATRDKSAPPPAESETATITVLVPVDAEVYFDGTPTTQTGTRRVFYTPALAAGANYTYSIRAAWTEDGRPVQQTRTVPVQAGARVSVDFTSPLP